MSKDIGTLQDKEGNTVYPFTMETISNDNGTALKFPDGTMICYGELIIPSIKLTPQSGGFARINTVQFYDFPVSFISTPNITYSVSEGTTTGDNSAGVIITKHPDLAGSSTQNTTLTSPGRFSLGSFGICDYTNVKVCYQAIGRWK